VGWTSRAWSSFYFYTIAHTKHGNFVGVFGEKKQGGGIIHSLAAPPNDRVEPDRVARFFSTQNTKTGENILYVLPLNEQMDKKYTKWP
jgi:hypothetical protein